MGRDCLANVAMLRAQPEVSGPAAWWAAGAGSLHDRLIAVRQQRDLPVVSVYHH